MFGFGLQAKWNREMEAQPSSSESIGETEKALDKKVDNGLNLVKTVAHSDASKIEEAAVSSDEHFDPVVQLNVVRLAREEMSENKSSMDEWISGGIIDILVKCLESGNPDLQLEATWTLVDITSGTSEQTYAVSQAGAISSLLELIHEPNRELGEQALWVLGNIIGDGTVLRDKCIIEHGVVQSVLKLLTASNLPLTFLRIAVWVLVNLCRGDQPPPNSATRALLAALFVLLHNDDTSVLVDVICAISYLAIGCIHQIQHVVNAGVVPSLIDFFSHSEPKIQIASLRAVEKITKGNSAQIQHVLDCGALKEISVLAKNACPGFKDKIIELLANISAGNEQQVQALFGADLTPFVISALSGPKQEVAASIVVNMTSKGKLINVLMMVKLGVVEPLCDLLAQSNSKSEELSLESLGNMLNRSAPNSREVWQKIEEYGGVTIMKQLKQQKNNEAVADLANSLLNKFLLNEEDGEFVIVEDLTKVKDVRL